MQFFKFNVMAQMFTDANFEEEVLKSEQPVLVDFGRSGADHVRRWVPLSRTLEEAKGNGEGGWLDVDENPNARPNTASCLFRVSKYSKKGGRL